MSALWTRDFYYWERAFNRITYKPYVCLILEEPKYLGGSRGKSWDFYLRMRFVFTVPDSMNPGQKVDINHQNVIDSRSMADSNHFIHFVRERLKIAEFHELDEFFKVDGKMLKDPHALDRKMV